MVLTADRQRVASLIKDTLSLLCRNGLTFKNKFCIEALIGITLDDDDVFLVNIKDTIGEDPPPPSPEPESAAESTSKRSYDEDQTDEYSETDNVEPVNKKPMLGGAKVKSEWQSEDEEDDLVFVKNEPGDNNVSYPSTPVSYSQGQSSWGSNSQPSSQSMHPALQQQEFYTSGSPQSFQANRKVYHPFKCEECGKTFGSNSGLNYHVNMTHRKVYRFHCKQCDKGFQMKAHYDGHMMRHTKEEPMACKLCGSKFLYRSNLTAHLKRKHNVSAKALKYMSYAQIQQARDAVAGVMSGVMGGGGEEAEYVEVREGDNSMVSVATTGDSSMVSIGIDENSVVSMGAGENSMGAGAEGGDSVESSRKKSMNEDELESAVFRGETLKYLSFQQDNLIAEAPRKDSIDDDNRDSAEENGD